MNNICQGHTGLLLHIPYMYGDEEHRRQLVMISSCTKADNECTPGKGPPWSRSFELILLVSRINGINWDFPNPNQAAKLGTLISKVIRTLGAITNMLAPVLCCRSKVAPSLN